MDKDVFDYDKLIESFMGERDLAKEAFMEFLKKVPKQLDIIEDAIDMSSYDVVKFEAHSIKGAAYNMASKIIGDAARDLEYNVKNGNFQDIKDSFETLKSEFEILQASLKEINL
ncbi:MAG TPA: Hpt domain-containing protein [Spirochaetota bacterium]|mgnify:FL=1|nr:Hpt domain-containing protein [Spirochaetota bacterium]HOS33946.1 Hpt domain-containing protein [Spirochaetota bacterium]HOS55196.1 Hpt domain-containing protein [Spirochaetota bacterium]HPK63193.1 Hpt domain-containing protein [Spirochaetota bacterium]HQF77394.1 Hpt domain-containing protein [Spirochaetota bacterium]